MAVDPSAVPNFSVAGKHVLISGGAGGLGSAIARAFCGLGATVAVADVKPAGASVTGHGIAAHVLDVRDTDAVNALAARLERLDVLIHCAGKLVRMGEWELDTFQDILQIHLVGAMRLATAFKPHLVRSQGCMINIASMYSYFGSPRIPAYGAAKSAIIQLTKTLALAWAQEGVRVNAIAPGWFKTEMTLGAREDPDFNRRVTERLPTGRWNEPEELAGTAVFLASAAARAITGVTIPVDGGYTAT